MGIWRIEEPEQYFLEKINLFPEERAQLEQMTGRRRLEWLAVRWLLHQMSGRAFRSPCLKDEHGKPYLLHSLYDISISHSNELAAVIAAPRAVGIDVQRKVAKIERIAHKYMGADEMDSLKEDIKLEQLHIYWGAKEALYKAYGRRQLDFKNHIFIQPFVQVQQQGQLQGYIEKEDFFQDYRICYRQIEDYILVYALQDIGDQRMAT